MGGRAPPRAENFLREEGGGLPASVLSESVSHARAGGSGGVLFAKKCKMSTSCSKIDFWMKKWLLGAIFRKKWLFAPKGNVWWFQPPKSSKFDKDYKHLSTGGGRESFFLNFHFSDFQSKKVTSLSKKWLLDGKYTFTEKVDLGRLPYSFYCVDCRLLIILEVHSR